MPYSALKTPVPSDQAEQELIPIWTLLGGIMLAGTAGFINSCLLGFSHFPVSHVTGSVSRLSIDLETANFVDLRLVGSIVVGFLIGAILSGVIISKEDLSFRRPYGVTLIIEGLTLGAATLLLYKENLLAIPLTALACGLQNAMASSYKGLIIRTTHVTGILTDIGFFIGRRLRREPVQSWKLLVLIALFFGFLVGGLVGAICLHWFGPLALSLPTAGCFVIGVAYLIGIGPTHTSP